MLRRKALTHGKSRASAVLAIAAVVFLPLTLPVATAADILRVGEASPSAFDMMPVQIGVAEHIFEKHGLAVEVVDFAGDAKMHQAFAADSIDAGVAGCPGLAFIAKGAPEIAVAAVVEQPRDVAIIVPYETTIKSLDDLKGRKIGISTAGSLTYWMAAELNRVKGWGDRGVAPIAIGDFSGRIAALRTGQLDATFASDGFGFQLEEQNRGASWPQSQNTLATSLQMRSLFRTDWFRPIRMQFGDSWRLGSMRLTSYAITKPRLLQWLRRPQGSTILAGS